MGDFSAQFHRPESGIHTVEGTVAGSGAAFWSKKRQREQEEFEARKKNIAESAKKQTKMMGQKFAIDSSLTDSEKKFRAKTVGLVSAEDFKRAREEREKKKIDGDNEENGDGSLSGGKKAASKKDRASKKAKKRKRKEKKRMMAKLSFASDEYDENNDDEENERDESESNTGKKNGSVHGGADETETKSSSRAQVSMKNPTVDTSFLPDRAREQRQVKEQERLKAEWVKKQESMKGERLEIVYSYWDGSGHRRTVECRKGDSIGDFLEKVRVDLTREFRELQSTTSDALLYVKEDLILPHDLSFYDLIVTKARGKSGPLFHFGVKEDIRIGAVDSRVEKDESHPGKVVERSWYERNKHIFPASRWEIFDPAKTYGKYTIHGGEVQHK